MALSALNMGNGYATHRSFLQGDLKLSEESDVIRFAHRINLHVSPELDERYPRNFVAELTVRYSDGTSEHIFLDHAKGMPSNPFAAEEHRSKLNELAYDVIGEQQADELFDAIDCFRPTASIGELTALIQRR
jgi:2-methylcitrate dehydratase PrpD